MDVGSTNVGNPKTWANDLGFGSVTFYILQDGPRTSWRGGEKAWGILKAQLFLLKSHVSDKQHDVLRGFS